MIVVTLDQEEFVSQNFIEWKLLRLTLPLQFFPLKYLFTDNHGCLVQLLLIIQLIDKGEAQLLQYTLHILLVFWLRKVPTT